MRLYEYRQSATSPLKYHLELTPEELETTKDLVAEIIEKIEIEKGQRESVHYIPTPTFGGILESMSKPANEH